MHLYKYRSLSGCGLKYAENIICGSRAYFSSPLSFNDPFDCVPAIDFNVTQKEKKDYLTRLYKKKMPNLNRAEIRREAADTDWQTPPREVIYSVLAKPGVFCLSEKFDNMLMWSHYCSNNTGICLRFRHSSSERFFGSALNVCYVSDRPKFNPIRDNESKTLVDKVLLSRAECWSYEKEWRVIDHTGPGSKGFNPTLLDAVYLGAKISIEHREKVLGWVRDRGDIEVFQGRLDDTEYRLIFDCIN